MAKQIKTFYGNYSEKDLVSAFEKVVEDYSSLSVESIEKENTIKDLENRIEELAGRIVELMCEVSDLKNKEINSMHAENSVSQPISRQGDW